MLSFNHLDIVQEQTFELRLGTNCGAMLENMVDAFCFIESLLNFIPNFIHHHFWCKTLQELG